MSGLQMNFGWKSVTDGDSAEFGSVDHSEKVRGYLKDMSMNCSGCEEGSSLSDCICQDEGGLKPKRGTVPDSEKCTFVIGNEKAPSMSVSTKKAMTAVANTVQIGANETAAAAAAAATANSEFNQSEAVDCDANPEDPRCVTKKGKEQTQVVDVLNPIVFQDSVHMLVGESNRFFQEQSTCVGVGENGGCLFSEDEDEDIE